MIDMSVYLNMRLLPVFFCADWHEQFFFSNIKENEYTYKLHSQHCLHLFDKHYPKHEMLINDDQHFKIEENIYFIID
jgi:hypothetical protein